MKKPTAANPARTASERAALCSVIQPIAITAAANGRTLRQRVEPRTGWPAGLPSEGKRVRTADIAPPSEIAASLGQRMHGAAITRPAETRP